MESGCLNLLEFAFKLSCFLLIGFLNTQGTIHGPNQYCNMEPFNVSCGKLEVIVMHSALYGRMRIGRCVKVNYGNLGCEADVLRYLDYKCSGRQYCHFGVPDPTLYAMKDCPDDITPYLEASHECVKVEVGHRKECVTRKRIQLSGPHGYLASHMTEEYGYGSGVCPWVIHVQEGQRINLTLFNFALGYGTHPNLALSQMGRQDFCFEVAEIIEGRSKSMLTVCEREPRIRSVYLSKTNLIKIEVINKRLLQSLGAFLLKYEALGCADPRPLPDTWNEREGPDSIKIHCNNTDETYHLSCKDNVWVGSFNNCSKSFSWTLSQWFSSDEDFPYGILIVVFIGIALGICVGGVLLVVVMVYARRRRREGNQNQKNAIHEKEHTTLENRPIMNGGTQQAQWSGQGSYRATGTGNYTPTRDPTRNPTRDTTRDSRSLPHGPKPLPNPPAEQTTVSGSVIQNLHVGESESGYGSAGTGTPTFSTFRPKPQHIYESPHFT